MIDFIESDPVVILGVAAATLIWLVLFLVCFVKCVIYLKQKSAREEEDYD
jgi:cbb3-type cytochrome oxidase subunit 3